MAAVFIDPRLLAVGAEHEILHGRELVTNMYSAV